MKLVWLVYGSALDEQVTSGLAGIGVVKFTKLPNILGAGGTAEPRLNDSVWPGTNQGLLIGCDEGAKEKIMELARELKKQFPQEGVKAFVLPLEEVV